jgi:hypothetical protein
MSLLDRDDTAGKRAAHLVRSYYPEVVRHPCDGCGLSLPLGAAPGVCDACQRAYKRQEKVLLSLIAAAFLLGVAILLGLCLLVKTLLRFS